MAKEHCCVTNYLQPPTLNSPPPMCDNTDCSSGNSVRTVRVLALHQCNLPLAQPPHLTANQLIRCCVLKHLALLGPHLLHIVRSIHMLGLEWAQHSPLIV